MDCQKQVAVKVLHSDKAARYRLALSTRQCFYSAVFSEEFCREINLMYNIGEHEHILRLIGHAFDGSNPLLVLEFCANGDLLTFARTHLRTNKHSVYSVRDEGRCL